MPDCIDLVRYHTSSGIVSFFSFQYLTAWIPESPVFFLFSLFFSHIFLSFLFLFFLFFPPNYIGRYSPGQVECAIFQYKHLAAFVMSHLLGFDRNGAGALTTEWDPDDRHALGQQQVVPLVAR
jgi:hypothetical protein